MSRIFAAFALLLAICIVNFAPAGGKTDDPKEALQALQEFIGTWNGTGTPVGSRDIWKEKAEWNWRFKGKDIWLSLDMPLSKHITNAEIRYLPEKGKYQFTTTEKGSKTKNVFEGELKKGNLVLSRADAETKESHQIEMKIVGGGVRFLFEYFTKPESRTLYNKKYTVAMTKEGESFGTAAKKNECVVTGGLGTMAVSFKGMTYYVCCSGCRDAFNENPEKILAEYAAKKKKEGR